MAQDPDQVALVTAALNLFPPLVRDALIEDRAFRSHFNLKTTARISLNAVGVTFQRESLFAGIREALAKPAAHSLVVDQEGGRWKVTIEEANGVQYTGLVSDTQLIRLPFFWALSPDQAVRLAGFDKESKLANLHDCEAGEWRAVLTAAPLDDEDLELLRNELSLTPTNVAESIAHGLKASSCDLSTLVPNVDRYFDRLVGHLGGCNDLYNYLDRESRSHIAQLLNWHPADGLRLSLLQATHPAVASTIAQEISNADQLEPVLAWIQGQGDMFSKLGAIELGLALLDKAPQLEPILEKLVRDILADDPEDPLGHFSTISSLLIFVCDEMARTKVLSRKPPFWARHAAIAQASLIQRSLLASGCEPENFLSWARENRGQRFFFQALVDLRLEPRWLPDFASAKQLKAEFLGRIAEAASKNEAKIQSSELRKLVSDDSYGIMTQMKFPFPYLPGPLEGGCESSFEIPQQLVADLEQLTASERLDPDAFSGLVNSAFLFRIGADQARLAATALREVKYRLRHEGGENGPPAMFALISGLATVAATSRCKELANETRVLSRVTRRTNPVALELGDQIHIALLAAASREDLSEWASFVGDWLTELAFEVQKEKDAKLFFSQISCLTHLEPKLLATCAKAKAALSSIQ